jgi:hypothetical protein
MQQLASFAVLLGAAGCANQADLAAALKAAARPEALPKVVACWERAFEAAGFRGDFLATVDFEVAADGTLSNVALRSFVDTASGSEITAADDADELASCVESALGNSKLAPYSIGEPVTVSGYRIALSDGSAEARATASEQGPTVLIGPRSDRCSGLYAHEPPRELGVLQTALADAAAEAERDPDAPDRLARALQKRYDLALELADRLRVEVEDPSLSPVARKRIDAERDRTLNVAREVGAKIGCAR